MLMALPHPELQFNHALPYGAVNHERGVQFVVFSRNATAMRLLLYKNVDDREPYEVIKFDPDTDLAPIEIELISRQGEQPEASKIRQRWRQPCLKPV